MGLFSNFPYSDFENINLDWIIRKVKEYVLKVDALNVTVDNFITYVNQELEAEKKYIDNYFENLDVQDEINNKLDEMASSGQLAEIISQFLQTQAIISFNTLDDLVNADNLNDGMTVLKLGNTRYNDGYTNLYKIRALTSADIIDGINILRLTNYNNLIAERINEVAKTETALSISPVYLGEHITPLNTFVSSCLVIDNIAYIFSFITNNDYGVVDRYDLTTNTYIDNTSIRLGHANSVCYDPDNEIIYVVPVLEYSQGTEAYTSNIYKYSKNLQYLGLVTAPKVMMGISYDNVNRTIYTYNLDDNEVYKLENDIFTLVTSLYNIPELNIIGNLPTYNDKKFNQDIAVHNNILYLSTPYNVIASFDLTSGNYLTSRILTAIDSEARYYMGELEGMEFKGDHLIALKYTQITNQCNYGFMVEIPINNVYPAPVPQRTATNATIQIDPTIQNAFSLAPWQVKSLLALQLRVYKGFYRVQINGAVNDPYIIQLNDDIALLFNSGCVYTCKYMQLISANVTLQGSGELVTSEPRNNSDSLVIEQGSQLYLAVSSLRVRPANTDFIITNPLYAPQLTVKANIINNAGGSVLIGTTPLTKGFWVGDNKIADLN